MKSRPILFSAPMVRAILEGRKTQTRRVVKPVGNDEGFVIIDYGNGGWPYRSDDGDSTTHTVKRGGKLYHDETPHACPYGQTGDRLWVRETWRYTASSLEESRAITEDISSGIAVDWRATYIDNCMKLLGFSREEAEMADDFETWRPSIHMPRWASRILLEVTGVRVERLQDISEEDAKAEGADCLITANCTAEQRELLAMPLMDDATPYRNGYALLWESINGDGSWEANPWVWVIEFKRVTQ